MSNFYKNLRDKKSFILGPCLFETEEHMDMMIGELSSREGIENLLYKTSWQKANRSSKDSPSGGLHNIEGMDNVKSDHPGIEITTDVHDVSDVYFIEDHYSDLVDVYQIPAFLCRQTDLIQACAETGKTLTIKKGQFMSPEEMAAVVEKADAFGANEIILIERGTTFGYHNLVVDMRGIEIMKQYAPVIFDATHSVQLPGSISRNGRKTGGEPRFIFPLAHAALAAGADGIFAEVHQDPGAAPSDGASMLELRLLDDFVVGCNKVKETIKWIEQNLSART